MPQGLGAARDLSEKEKEAGWPAPFWIESASDVPQWAAGVAGVKVALEREMAAFSLVT